MAQEGLCRVLLPPKAHLHGVQEKEKTNPNPNPNPNPLSRGEGACGFRRNRN